MEASKCPKCGEEPLFIEHLSKWYCYGCNSYVDDERHECNTEHVHESALPIEEGVKALEHEETAQECKTCGAKLQDLKDGRLYCFMCETYQDVAAAEAPIVVEQKPEPNPESPVLNESQKLIDEPPKTDGFVGEPEAVVQAESPAPQVMETKIDVTMPVIINIEDAAPRAAEPEPEPVAAPKAPEPKVRMCTTCGQPLKYIDKYSRYYCYACRKYAPRDDPARTVVKAPASVAGKTCPDCGRPLKYVEKYTEWYCYECKKYPLRERAKAKAAAKPAPEVPSCPNCGDPLKYVPQYSRHYCYKCKKYAPKDSVQKPVAKAEPKQEAKSCPVCHEHMKYVTEYNEWYCYKCRKYSLRPVKPVLL